MTYKRHQFLRWITLHAVNEVGALRMLGIHPVTEAILEYDKLCTLSCDIVHHCENKSAHYEDDERHLPTRRRTDHEAQNACRQNCLPPRSTFHGVAWRVELAVPTRATQALAPSTVLQSMLLMLILLLWSEFKNWYIMYLDIYSTAKRKKKQKIRKSE